MIPGFNLWSGLVVGILIYGWILFQTPGFLIKIKIPNYKKTQIFPPFCQKIHFSWFFPLKIKREKGFFRHGLVSGGGKGRMFHFLPGHGAGAGNSFIRNIRINGKSPFFSTLINSGIAFPDKSRDFIAHFPPPLAFPGHSHIFLLFLRDSGGSSREFQSSNPIPGADSRQSQGRFGMGKKRF